MVVLIKVGYLLLKKLGIEFIKSFFLKAEDTIFFSLSDLTSLVLFLDRIMTSPFRLTITLFSAKRSQFSSTHLVPLLMPNVTMKGVPKSSS